MDNEVLLNDSGFVFQSLTLPITFIITMTICLWFVIWSKGYWWIKVPVMSATLFFSFCIWTSVGSFLGWSSAEDPPRKFKVISTYVQEPSKVVRDGGSIYLLLQQIKHPEDPVDTSWDKVWGCLDYKKEKDKPRLYLRPYSRPLHEAVSQAQGLMNEGETVLGEFKNGKFQASGDKCPKCGQPHDGSKGKGAGKGKSDTSGDGEAGDGESCDVCGQPHNKKGVKKGRSGNSDNDGLAEMRFYIIPKADLQPK